MNYRQLNDENSSRKLYDIYEKVYRKGTVEGAFDWEIKNKYGSFRSLETSASLMKDSEGKPIGFRGIVRDITDRKQAEEALLKSEKGYRELINSITDFIYSHDLAGRFTMVNRAAAETLGYVPEDLIGHPISDFMLPEHRQAFKEGYLAQIKEKGYLDGLAVYLAKNGSKRYIEYRNVLVKQEGMESFISGSGRDITEKVLSDRKLHRLEEQLQRAQKMEAMGTLAGGVAHDLNNVLSGIVSYPELLLLDIPEDSPLRKPILTIQKSGKKAADIVQDLLTLARRGVVVTEVVNLNNILDDYLKSPEIENLKGFYPDAKIESNLEGHLLNIMGSPVHLSKSVMNLVNNAAEAMPDGGNIFISAESKYIDKPIRGYDDVEEGDYAVITVSDTGIGISPEDIEMIFEP
ncbi:MAG: PAS domain S-box protein, partial [Desulfobacterales bacterium]|nr:PAS domain S-box protein [Desulfobacterales bacterium]